MTAAYSRNRYASDSISTASPAKLLVMLYDRLVLDLERAELAQTEGKREKAHDALVHAQDIVMELHSSLREDAWAGAAGLSALYTFLHAELVQANVKCDAKRTVACRKLIEPLRDAWRDAAAAQAVAAAPLVTGAGVAETLA